MSSKSNNINEDNQKYSGLKNQQIKQTNQPSILELSKSVYLDSRLNRNIIKDLMDEISQSYVKSEVSTDDDGNETADISRLLTMSITYLRDINETLNQLKTYILG